MGLWILGNMLIGDISQIGPQLLEPKWPQRTLQKKNGKSSWKNLKRAHLKCFPSQLQATKVMAELDILSTHCPDEEYIGEKMDPSWAENPIIKAAVERFSGRLKRLEALINERNQNTNLKNRNRAGIVPYIWAFEAFLKAWGHWNGVSL